MTLRETFAANLRELRAERSMSQEELAHRAQLDRTYVSALERAVYAASLDVLERVALALEVEPSTLLSKRS